MASATKDGMQQAMVVAGVKANVKLAGDLATFRAALMESLEDGIESAPPVCKHRVATLGSELEQVQKLVEVYPRRNFNTLTGHSVKV